MKPVDVLLANLARDGVRIALEGDNLRVTPRSALTPALVEELKARKSDIMSFLRRGTADAARAIPRAPRSGLLPLSHAQERLWFLSRLEDDSATYNMSMCPRLLGKLDAAALEQSLQEIVRRHEILRTTFVLMEGAPRQNIGAPAFRLPIVDLSALSPADRGAEVARRVKEDAAQRFRLDEEPPFRATLLRLGEAEHVLLLNMHHIASDGLSTAVLMREFGALYAAFREGKPSPLPELSIQYADYAAWHRAHLSSEVMADKLAHWKRKLEGAPPLLSLPQDHPRPPRAVFEGGSAARLLSRPLSSALRALGQQHDATLFVTLLAAYQLLLSRWSGERDIVVGTPVAGRSHVELEGLLGPFLNSLVLRTDLSGAPTFAELLGRVRRVALDAFAHQDVPFEKIVAELSPARHLNHGPLYQVMFNMVPAATGTLELPGLRVEESVDQGETEAKLDLTLYAVDVEDGVVLRTVYNAALFSAPRMEHLLDQYAHLLQQIVEDPSRPIDTYSLVTPAARALLPDMKVTLPQPSYPPVPVEVAAWAERTPDQIALIRGTDTWTYRELAQKAAGISSALVELGVQAGDIVAVWGGKSFGLVASMLGILDAGGAFLLLDPRLPRPRLATMLEESGAKYAISLTRDDREAAWLSARHLRELLVHPRHGLERPDGPRLPLGARPPSPDTPAYVFFTSGTTGVPKGVLGVHKGLAHFLSWERKQFGVGPGDRVAQLIALSFDAVLRDVFLPLTSGGSLALHTDDDMVDGRRLADWIERDGITFLHTVPSVVETWLADIPEGRTMPSLRCAIIAGEPLRDSLIRRFRERFPRCRVVNFYGTTETTMSKFFFDVPDPPLPGVQPIGFALPETHGLVLRDGRLCGVGEAGEIVIRTPFRTKGYLNGSEADRRRFGKNPHTDDPEDLLYFTGDVGRYRPDGSISIFGRGDEQVKIRGIRVELRAIEAVLAQHPDIERVAVTTVGEGARKQIVAYVVGRRKEGSQVATAPSAATLRHFMQEKVPDYMIPATFVAMETLPLNTSGKIDRRALPQPDERTAQRRLHIPPRNVDEHKLLEIWESVLEVAPISVRDNFFELGGHSLLAVRLMAKVEETFGKHLPLSAVFQHPTVEEMTQLLLRSDESDLWAPLVPIKPRGSRRPLFCIPGLGGNVVAFHDLAQYLGSDQPVYGLQTMGLDGITEPYTTIEEVVTRYIAEIRAVAPQGPYRICGHSWGGRVAFAMTQDLVRAGEKVSLWVFDSSSPDMAANPLVKPFEEKFVIADLIFGIGVTFDEDFSITPELLEPLPSDDRFGLLRSCLEKVGILAPGTSLKHVRGLLNVFHANRQMNYVPRDILPTPFVFFVAEDEGEELGRKKIAGWTQLVPVTAVHVPGAHVNLIEEPHVQSIARRMAADLASLDAEDA
ncbi:non-ribosomal peptide synthetase [Polyangium sorediatum]|uniref:Non-ribosomal peptide synthetase n=1 Tax=Polyangium sorediatum TaxID=889274 RepID=A0ABT6NYM3_9BACT|nr:non-ribosomal peptide synthetase [Polyangium sorediatum]MDI1433381.1 non-ribosomal peptide synthetase [Polyangium sorediatum]